MGKRHTQEQRVLLVRKILRLKRQGVTPRDACRKFGISTASFHRWLRWADSKSLVTRRGQLHLFGGQGKSIPITNAGFLDDEENSGGHGDLVTAASGLVSRLSNLESKYSKIEREWNAFKVTLGVTEADLAPKGEGR